MRCRMRLLIVVLAVALILPGLAQARGNGWKDMLIGAGLGTAFGAAAGGATLVFIEPQSYQDFIFPAHYLTGAGIGLILGTTGGALVGFLPEKEKPAETVSGLLSSTPFPVTYNMPLVGVKTVQTDPGKYEAAYMLYPVRLSF